MNFSLALPEQYPLPLLEKETILTNTKRVNTAGKTLKKRATDLDTEIKSFKEKLNKL